MLQYRYANKDILYVQMQIYSKFPVFQVGKRLFKVPFCP